MKYKYTTTLTKKECTRFFKNNVDAISLSLGEEKFVGWNILDVFSLSYRSGKMRMYNPIFNKIIGTWREQNGDTYVTFSLYKGLTDFISFSWIFIASFAILSIVFNDLNVFSRAALSLLCCFFAALITFGFTWMSEEGEENRIQLVVFLERNLELKKLNP